MQLFTSQVLVDGSDIFETFLTQRLEIGILRSLSWLIEISTYDRRSAPDLRKFYASRRMESFKALIHYNAEWNSSGGSKSTQQESLRISASKASTDPR